MKVVKNFYRSSAEDFKKIPGSPFAYWVGDGFINVFDRATGLGTIASPRAGLATGDNTIYQRYWYEVSLNNISFNCSSNQESMHSVEKWYPCNSGGDYRKWYGNNITVVNWQQAGKEIKNFKDEKGKLKSRPQNTDYYFKPGITWSKISSNNFAARIREPGYIFDDTGRSAFPNEPDRIKPILSFMCSSLADCFLKILNPSMSFTSGDISNLPVLSFNDEEAYKISEEAVQVFKMDWDAFEVSWNFCAPQIILCNETQSEIHKNYKLIRDKWYDLLKRIYQLELRNNGIFIEAYGLQDELTPEVPLEKITLTCNPYYRYGADKSEEEQESLLLADTMRELISYAVGCIFGRYSLDKEGLILANAGDGIDEYLQQIPEPAFHPDESGILPLTTEADFTDDLPSQVSGFIRVAFGNEFFDQNIRFIEEAIGKNLRNFLLKEFYKDHLKRYKKRPIYWMVSSPKGSFRSLIYLHRYTPDTVGKLLNEYVRPFMKKLEAKIDHARHQISAGGLGKGEETKLQKAINVYQAQHIEISDWERTVYELAAKRMELDLDDGVKVNYAKLGEILEPIKGLNA